MSADPGDRAGRRARARPGQRAQARHAQPRGDRREPAAVRPAPAAGLPARRRADHGHRRQRHARGGALAGLDRDRHHRRARRLDRRAGEGVRARRQPHGRARHLGRGRARRAARRPRRARLRPQFDRLRRAAGARPRRRRRRRRARSRSTRCPRRATCGSAEPHRVICGSSTDAAAVGRLFGDDHCQASSPTRRTASPTSTRWTRRCAIRARSRRGIARSPATTSRDPVLEALVKDSLTLACAHAAQGAGCYVFHADSKRLLFEAAMARAGFLCPPDAGLGQAAHHARPHGLPLAARAGALRLEAGRQARLVRRPAALGARGRRGARPRGA